MIFSNIYYLFILASFLGLVAKRNVNAIYFYRFISIIALSYHIFYKKTFIIYSIIFLAISWMHSWRKEDSCFYFFLQFAFFSFLTCQLVEQQHIYIICIYVTFCLLTMSRLFLVCAILYFIFANSYYSFVPLIGGLLVGTRSKNTTLQLILFSFMPLVIKKSVVSWHPVFTLFYFLPLLLPEIRLHFFKNEKLSFFTKQEKNTTRFLYLSSAQLFLHSFPEMILFSIISIFLESIKKNHPCSFFIPLFLINTWNIGTFCVVCVYVYQMQCLLIQHHKKNELLKK